MQPPVVNVSNEKISILGSHIAMIVQWMELAILGIMEKKMETTIVYWGYIGIMKNKMETTRNSIIKYPGLRASASSKPLRSHCTRRAASGGGGANESAPGFLDPSPPSTSAWVSQACLRGSRFTAACFGFGVWF